MRSRLARIAILDTVCLFGLTGAIHSQQTRTTAVPGIQATRSCPSPPAADDGQPSGPQISIAEVTFSGFLQMPISDQDQIAASVKRQPYRDHGYFKVQVSGDAKRLPSTPGQRIALSFHVDEGSQYNLAGISFKNNSAIRDVGALRGLFPLKDGETKER